MKLLLDQGVRYRVAAELGRRGLDAVHTRDLGLARAADEDIMARARLEERVVVTLDSDFGMLLAIQGAVTPSVIQVREHNPSVDTTVSVVLQVVATLGPQLNQGAMVSAMLGRARYRLLPMIGPD